MAFSMVESSFQVIVTDPRGRQKDGDILHGRCEDGGNTRLGGEVERTRLLCSISGNEETTYKSPSSVWLYAHIALATLRSSCN